MKGILFLIILLGILGGILYLALYHAGFKRMFGKYFYNWLYGLKWGQTDTNNYGYSPAGREAEAMGEGEKYQLQLYAELGKTIPAEEWPKLNVLEVGCGRGGGLRFLSQTLKPLSVTGMDFSENAIQYCRKRTAEMKLNMTWRKGDAHALPFSDGQFDVILNVESSHIYADQGQFFREVKRVLKPGGHFLIADYRELGPEGMDKMRHQFLSAGLKNVFERKISENVLEACKADTERREVLIKNAPGFMHNYMREFAMVENSKEYRGFLDHYHYFIIKLERV